MCVYLFIDLFICEIVQYEQINEKERVHTLKTQFFPPFWIHVHFYDSTNLCWISIEVFKVEMFVVNIQTISESLKIYFVLLFFHNRLI